MNRREVYQAAIVHEQMGQSGTAIFSMLILIDQSLLRIARALEARGDGQDRNGGRVVGASPVKTELGVRPPEPAPPAHISVAT